MQADRWAVPWGDSAMDQVHHQVHTQVLLYL